MSKSVKKKGSRISLLDRDIVYLPSPLIQVTMPHKDPGNVQAWQRQNGKTFLVLQPGWDPIAKKSIGYPFGVTAKMLILWMTQAVMETKSRVLDLGGSMAEFMRYLGLDPSTGGGVHGDAFNLKKQMTRLLRVMISLEYISHEEGGVFQQWNSIQIAPKGEMWWNGRNNWQGKIELGEEFYKILINNKVPLDMDALRKLTDSPMAIDFYCLLTWKSSQAEEQGREKFMKWEWLQQQIGSGLTDKKNFARNAKKAVIKVIDAYPRLRAEAVRGGVIVTPNSKPSVPRSIKTLLEQD